MNRENMTGREELADEEVIARVLQGERDLYAIIVRRYNQRLYRVGMSILNADSEVEDAMQTAYINAYENLAKFAFRSAFSTWLTRILINECLLCLRKKGKLISLNEEEMEHAIPDHAAPCSAAGKVLQGELTQLLNDAILQLPEKYRAVFIMREIEQMTVAETRECLNISAANVKVRLNRAKAMLQVYLSSKYSNEDILHFHLERCDRMVDAVMEYIGRAGKNLAPVHS